VLCVSSASRPSQSFPTRRSSDLDREVPADAVDPGGHPMSTTPVAPPAPTAPDAATPAVPGPTAGHRRRSSRRSRQRLVVDAIVVVFALLWLLPVYWMVKSSLQLPVDL